MNPEQNKQPDLVDQPPQPDLTNQPSITPIPEPTIIQPAFAVQPSDTATPQPVVQATGQPIQPPQTITQPAATASTAQKSKKSLVIGGIAVVIIIVLASGAFAYSKIGSDDSSKNKDVIISDDTVLDDTPTDNSESSTAESEKTTENISENTDTTTAPDSNRTAVLARDTERKNELKMAQQQLESYFNDNGQYPADWTVVVIDSDGRIGPDGDPYTYVVAADLQSYTLSANLENDSDPRADVNGNYVILSINI